MPSVPHPGFLLQRTGCFRIAFAVLLGSLSGVLLHAETKNVQLLDLLRALKMAPNTQVIAARQGFVLHDLQIGMTGAKAQAGDQVTALVSLFSLDGKLRPTQWIIRLRLTEKSGADSPQAQTTDVIAYTNTGDSFTFRSDLSHMDLETLGPIPDKAKPDLQLKVKRHSIFVRTDFLCLNLTGAARVMAKIHDSSSPISLSAGPRSFPADEVEAGRKQLASAKLTSDEVRSCVGSLPALSQFLDIVRSTPDLQGILLQVLQTLHHRCFSTWQ